MADQPINSSNTLTTLKEAGETLADSSQDIRGRDVIAKDGDKIGKVDALFVDNQEAKVRFMRVEAGGFLGIGEKKWLIPVDAITSVDKDHVHIDQSSGKIAGAPIYDPSVVANAPNDYFGGIYGYYGYNPYWGSSYRNPRWW